MEALLQSLIPDLASQGEGASEGQIERIERIAGRPLPSFYRWFLMRMGRSMGALAYETIEFTAERVLSCYAENEARPDPRFLLIGYDTDEMAGMHVHYDFDHPARDDARVVKRSTLGGSAHPQYETLREMLAWGKFLRYRVERHPQCCRGLLVDQDKDVLAHLRPVLASMGFVEPIATGRCCALFQRAEAALATSSAPDDEPKYHLFRLGGREMGTLRKILGVISQETQLEVEVKTWSPPIPS